MIACAIGNANLAQLLINSGANLELHDNTGLSFLKLFFFQVIADVIQELSTYISLRLTSIF